MNTLSSLRFEVWVDGEYGEQRYLSIRAERPEGSVGLRWIWFVIEGYEELSNVIRGRVSTLEDGYHKVMIHGDHWTFYDLEIPRESAGELKCPFVRIEMPRHFLKALQKVANKTWKMQKDAIDNGARLYDIPRITIEPSKEYLNRMVRLYGHGKGQVALDVDPQVKDRFDEHMKDDGFQSKIELLKQIAVNTTSAFFETGTVKIHKDWDGYYFQIVRPDGQRSLNGGVINHSREPGKFSWSIHT